MDKYNKMVKENFLKNEGTSVEWKINNIVTIYKKGNLTMWKQQSNMFNCDHTWSKIINKKLRSEAIKYETNKQHTDEKDRHTIYNCFLVMVPLCLRQLW